jgi:hypothetical protein
MRSVVLVVHEMRIHSLPAMVIVMVIVMVMAMVMMMPMMVM